MSWQISSTASRHNLVWRELQTRVIWSRQTFCHRSLVCLHMLLTISVGEAGPQCLSFSSQTNISAHRLESFVSADPLAPSAALSTEIHTSVPLPNSSFREFFRREALKAVGEPASIAVRLHSLPP